jgi:hypothetical protein
MQKEITLNYTEGEGIQKYDLSGTVILKKLNFAEKNALEEEATDIKMIGNIPQIKISTSKMKELAICKSLVKADLIETYYQEDKATKQIIPVKKPFEVTFENIRKLPSEIGEFLLSEYTELNSINQKKNEN